jgi:hypothetical protein
LSIGPERHCRSQNAGTLGSELTITGGNFIDANGGSTVVILNGLQTGRTYVAPVIGPKANNVLKVIIPQMTEGKYSVSVAVSGSYVSAAEPFTYIEP